MPPISERNDGVLIIYIIERCVRVIWILSGDEQHVQEKRETHT